jgi:bifunctional non-homologous end joining protein LigD
MTALEVEIEGRALRLTNLDKVLWPETGFTKGQMIDYYARAASVLLPHLSGRPLTLARFPDGVDGPGWYQTSCPHPPPWLPTLPVPSPRGGSGRDYCLVNDLPSLVWVANLAAVELHPLLSTSPRLETPTAVLFDLDPGPPAGLLECATIALRLRDVLSAAGLASWAKTSGSLGMHVHVPLNSPAGYDQTRPFARSVAALLARRHPDRVVDRMARAARSGRVFVDWSQNHANRSTAGVYSLRAQDWPLVSTPLAWEEVEAAVAGGDECALVFDAGAVLERIERHGDLFRPVLELAQVLPDPAGQEAALSPP